jgi:hypothetical protein
MPAWTLEELEQCRAQLYPQVAAGLLASLFAVVGGVPRFVLDQTSSLLARGYSLSSVERKVCEDTQKRMWMCRSLDNLIVRAGGLDASDGMSHVLMHIIPDLPAASSDAQADDSKIAPPVPA